MLLNLSISTQYGTSLSHLKFNRQEKPLGCSNASDLWDILNYEGNMIRANLIDQLGKVGAIKLILVLVINLYVEFQRKTIQKNLKNNENSEKLITISIIFKVIKIGSD